MTKFERACIMSCNEWARSLPDSPKFVLSRKGEQRLLSIVDRMDGKVVRRFPRRVVRFILVAAVIGALLIATTVFAVIGQSDFDILKKSDMSEYSINGSAGQIDFGDLTVSYVVNGFELVEISNSNESICRFLYADDNGSFYTVSKVFDEYNFTFDTEDYEAEQIVIDDIEYTYYKSNDASNGLIWNYGGYIYLVSGNISLEDALNVAKSTK